MYDHAAFDFYSKCTMGMKAPKWGHYGYSPKHSVDGLFLRDLMDANWSGAVRVPPSEAEIFVVPVLCSQAANGFCGNWDTGVTDLMSKMLHMTAGVRNHLIVCDDWQACMDKKWGAEFIVGCFEPFDSHGPWAGPWPGFTESERHQISVGYSTFLAATQLNEKTRNAPLVRWYGDRKYKLLFTGQHDGRDAYKYRGMLFNDIQNKTVRSDFFLFQQATQDEMQLLMLDATVVLTLPGDTSTTDRIFNAFESGTILAALSHDKARLLRALPFQFAVAWEQMFLWIDTAEFVRKPLDALSKITDALDARDIMRRRRIIRLMQKEVTWTHEHSRATLNVLEAALRKKKSLGF
jgi:hypothetical protein